MESNGTVIKNLAFACLGLGLIVLGFFSHTVVTSTERGIIAIPYLLIGLGCGIFGHYTGNIISYFSTKNNEELKRQDELL